MPDLYTTAGLAARETRTGLAVDAQRLWARLMAMAEIGRCGELGVNRPAFSPEDRAARRLLYGWARELGIDVFQDSIGNLFLHYPGSAPELPPILTGSHLDSQPTGGRFDGVVGVLAGLEALGALVCAGIRPLRSIEVVAWSNEEGGRFAPGCMGSQVFAGIRALPELLQVRDAGGTLLCDALAATLAALPEAPLRICQRPAAYLEAHIEQGPRLTQAGLAVGVVLGIQGCVWLEFDLRGCAAHAGTTPHEYRRDAFEGARRLIETMRDHCLKRSKDCRFTVGRVTVEPNTPNTIPGRVIFTVDFRDADPTAFDELYRELRATPAPVPYELQVRELFHHAPVGFPPETTQLVAEAARSLNIPTLELVSGAFHDALFLTTICPVGMVFIRCCGVSHNPMEHAEPSDIAAGAQVLLATLLRLSAN